MNIQRRCKVLYISDDVDEFHLLQYILGHERSDTVQFCSPEIQSIQAAIQQEIPDLALLMAVGIDAIALYQKCKAIPALANVPIILWRVPYPEEIRAAEARRVGMAGYVYYVFQPQHLLAARDTVLTGKTYYPPYE